MTAICPSCWGSKFGAPTDIPGTVQAECVVCNATGVVEDQQLSMHFKLSELLYSPTAVRLGIPNNPTLELIDHLKILANELLEPVRKTFGALHINSGLRLPVLNKAIGGSDTSAHRFGWAADILPIYVKRRDVIDYLSTRSEFPYDQIIFEGTWAHLARFAPDGKTVRHQVLMMFPGRDGKPGYSTYDPKDPRVNQ